MGDIYRCDHPTDADLLERLLAREADPHLVHCVPCSERAGRIGREIDGLWNESTGEPFDELFYRRQAARIRLRVAAGEGQSHSRPSVLRPGSTTLAWAGGATAVLVMLAVVLHGRAPLHRGGGPADWVIAVARTY